MADTQTTGFTLDRPGPLSGPNPFGFASVEEAREALQRHFCKAGDGPVAELRGVARTLDLLAMALSEAGDTPPELTADGLVYLADKLSAVQRELARWHTRGEQLSRIVTKQNLDALMICPAYQSEA